MITIVDYGMGNLRSVQKACERVGIDARVSSDRGEIATAEKLILPGVGAFRDAIAELHKQELVQPILAHIAADRPFLGICLGLQMLLEISHEDGRYDGLAVIPGEVVRFPDFEELKVPHMGWNRLKVSGEQPLLAGIPDDAYFYFVHSYYVAPQDQSVVAATSDYGIDFVSMIARGNMFATQFHPEKSQKVGLRLLKNFAEL
ncbi:Imidazole glycerol phosphate synthase subunit HisH 1 [Symmachiella macrocystis]|uniref:Imidazole glycerol phosphate synthase subunit HisH n=1 Tax=Symmachiella macrocystis TaxID=2527985 RepID=A0A5C6B3H3_9PLAN|nr:imidazole glycerol phosphate synthase subunit HisH [Symmachiella macrocystis]TWU06845.1 Imidazole glycerol phosphate synthase subunit HisH 1 [Symmachiella macrocystis]